MLRHGRATCTATLTVRLERCWEGSNVCRKEEPKAETRKESPIWEHWRIHGFHPERSGLIRPGRECRLIYCYSSTW